MDFSEAERSGFIDAFTQFWTMRIENNWTVEELTKAAKAILRGCEEHFRAAVTRVSRINGAVPPDKVEAFKTRAIGLLSVAGIDEFSEQANLIIRDFPRLKTWMEWWMRPSHATMLFSSQRLMKEHVVKSIPNTTNAEEAMHWRFYCAAGRDHSFMHGMNSLYKIAVDFERQFEAVNSMHLIVFIPPGETDSLSEGIPIRYRRPEAWKVTAAEIGRTKPTRSAKPDDKKRKKNDGRPPDTIKELLKPEKVTKKSSKRIVQEPAQELDISVKKKPPKTLTKGTVFGPPSYPWKHNSCWLDTALELLYTCLMRNYQEFSIILDSLGQDSTVRVILESMTNRRRIIMDAGIGNVKVSSQLGEQRNKIRHHLLDLGIIESLDGFDTIFVCDII